MNAAWARRRAWQRTRILVKRTCRGDRALMTVYLLTWKAARRDYGRGGPPF